MANKGKLGRLRIDQYPMILEIRVEFGHEDLQRPAEWKTMCVPHHLNWLGFRYKFLGVILRDATKGSEHFSTLIEINQKFYLHLGDADGLLILQPGSTETIDLSTVIRNESKTVPSRFYYVKVDERDGPSEWVDVENEPSPVGARVSDQVDQKSDGVEVSETMDLDEFPHG